MTIKRENKIVSDRSVAILHINPIKLIIYLEKKLVVVSFSRIFASDLAIMSFVFVLLYMQVI